MHMLPSFGLDIIQYPTLIPRYEWKIQTYRVDSLPILSISKYMHGVKILTYAQHSLTACY